MSPSIFRSFVLSLFFCVTLQASAPPQFVDSTPSVGALLAPGTFSSSAPLSAQFSDLSSPFNYSPSQTYCQLIDHSGNPVAGSSSINGGSPVIVRYTPFVPLNQGGLYTFKAFACGTDGLCSEQDITFTVQDTTTPYVAGLELSSQVVGSPIALTLVQSSPDGPYAGIQSVAVTLALSASSSNTIDWDGSSFSLFSVNGAVKTAVPITRWTVGTPGDSKIRYGVDTLIDGAGLHEIDVVTKSSDGSGNSFTGPPAGGPGPWQFTTGACGGCVPYSPTQTFTISPTGSLTPSVTPTSTATPTSSVSPSASVTATLTASPTQSATSTASPTVSPTPTMIITVLSPSPSPSATAAFASTSAWKPVLGPVPLKAGDPLCLYFDEAPAASSCQLYNLAGQTAAKADFGAETSPCMKTTRLSPGLYWARIEVITRHGAMKKELQKIAITP